MRTPILYLLSLSTLIFSCSDDDTNMLVSAPAKQNCILDEAASSATGAITSTTSAIVNGTAQVDGKAVSLMPGQTDAVGGIVSFAAGKLHQGCSATLIADRVVLTAAHCTLNSDKWDGDPATASKYLVPVSSYKFGVGGDMNNPKKLFDIEKVILHPSLHNITTPGILRNDLALLVLKESATKALPGLVPIPVSRHVLRSADVNTTLASGGFGSRTCQTYNFSPIRRWAKFSLSRLGAMDLAFKGSDGQFSFGDSGAGLLKTFADGRTRVISVLSLGVAQSGCAEHTGPRLEMSRDWFTTQIKQPCGAISHEGYCQGDIAGWCAGGQEIVTQDCSKTGKVCGKNACGASRCIKQEPKQVDPQCNDLDYMGRCAADGALEWCINGRYQRRECSRWGQTCGASGDTLVGYSCRDNTADAGPAADAATDAEPLPDLPPKNKNCDDLFICTNKCPADMWCMIECSQASPMSSRLLFGTLMTCFSCSIYGDPTYCDTSKPSFNQCSSQCASGITPACQACLATQCKSENDACDNDTV